MKRKARKVRKTSLRSEVAAPGKPRLLFRGGNPLRKLGSRRTGPGAIAEAERAIEIHARLSRMTSERDLFAGAVEQLAVGAILLDEHGQFLKANQLAAHILDEKDGHAFIERLVDPAL